MRRSAEFRSRPRPDRSPLLGTWAGAAILLESTPGKRVVTGNGVVRRRGVRDTICSMGDGLVSPGSSGARHRRPLERVHSASRRCGDRTNDSAETLPSPAHARDTTQTGPRVCIPATDPDLRFRRNASSLEILPGQIGSTMTAVSLTTVTWQSAYSNVTFPPSRPANISSSASGLTRS